jgi:hypothetical protein
LLSEFELSSFIVAKTPLSYCHLVQNFSFWPI